jgi:hypothetical protein
MSVIVAAGPYTVDSDLEYAPLGALLENAEDERPDVLVLVSFELPSALLSSTDFARHSAWTFRRRGAPSYQSRRRRPVARGPLPLSDLSTPRHSSPRLSSNQRHPHPQRSRHDQRARRLPSEPFLEGGTRTAQGKALSRLSAHVPADPAVFTGSPMPTESHHLQHQRGRLRHDLGRRPLLASQSRVLPQVRRGTRRGERRRGPIEQGRHGAHLPSSPSSTEASWLSLYPAAHLD